MCLLEGVPGLGKTLLVKSLSHALGMSFKRIQFTPDLMPSDIVGTEVLTEANGRREFQFKKGPIFAHVVLADEINRATPKTQSAVLEAMEEKQVTVFGESHVLESPFIVLATQNPIELEGTYPLPEAQLDRFFFKLLVAPPAPDELREILKRTTGVETGDAAKVLPEDGGKLVNEMKQLLRQVLIAPPIEDYVVRLVHATQGNGQNGGGCRLDQTIYSFWLQPARRPGDDPRRQGQCAGRRARPCQLRGCRKGYLSGAAPPHNSQLPG